MQVADLDHLAGADPGQQQRVDVACLELIVQVGRTEGADALFAHDDVASCGALDSWICVADASACIAALMNFLHAAACVDAMANPSDLAKALDVLRYVVVLIAIAGFAVALFG